MIDDGHASIRLLNSLFKGAPKIAAPWPRRGGLRGVPRVDPALVAGVLASPAVLAEVDPTTLNANQSWIVAEHVAYYLTDQWHVTGRTSADQWEIMNRFPLVLPDYRGRPTIMAGHHRAAAAMLRGEPLVARVTPGSWQVPVALTPSVHLEPTDDVAVARRLLSPLGLSDDEIDFAIGVARPRREGPWA